MYLRVRTSFCSRDDQRHIPRDVPEALPGASQFRSELVAGVPHLTVIFSESSDGVVEQEPGLLAGAAGAPAHHERLTAVPATLPL